MSQNQVSQGAHQDSPEPDFNFQERPSFKEQPDFQGPPGIPHRPDPQGQPDFSHHQWPIYRPNPTRAGFAPPAGRQQPNPRTPPNPPTQPNQRTQPNRRTQSTDPGRARSSPPFSSPPNNAGPQQRAHSAAKQRPALARDLTSGMVSGVSAGIGRHLGLPTGLIRLAFVGLSFASFAGVALYGVLWVMIPTRTEKLEAPGLEAAKHRNMRPERVRISENPSMVVAVAMIAFGVLMLVNRLFVGFPLPTVWPVVLAIVGVAMIWRQADQQETIRVGENVPRWLKPFLKNGGIGGALRIVFGLGLVGIALAVIAASRIGLAHLPMVLVIAAVVLSGVLVLAAPWIYSTKRKLDEARKEKLIADTRADIAAHLHDSVLQTLALIQRQAGDAKTVASLARSQERELRTWLYGEQEEAGSLKLALQEAAGSVEDEWGVPVELVCVGDIELDTNLSALVKAAREAITNAAKHSGAPMIDVFAEIEPVADYQVVSVFVRDRGSGFDPNQIADDRQGVKGSIQARMQRHGGSVRIRTAPGEGTEIKLEMKV